MFKEYLHEVLLLIQGQQKKNNYCFPFFLNYFREMKRDSFLIISFLASCFFLPCFFLLAFFLAALLLLFSLPLASSCLSFCLLPPSSFLLLMAEFRFLFLPRLCASASRSYGSRGIRVGGLAPCMEPRSRLNVRVAVNLDR